ncbi:hypothetical protein [uncultured Salinisphaera sp.]|uniref:hypothetical protein n=1 Tax=uncultured Salinisphaera sp. TaxID=359372 RepID=UPI0032B1C608
MTGSRWVSALIISAVLVAAGALAGCASPRGPQPAALTTAATGASSTPATPGAWVGRWHGADGATLDIHSTASDGGYSLVFHRPGRVDVTHDATAASGQLFYDAGTGPTALRPGTGTASADPDQRALTYCLVSAPGGHTYCRRRDTADALALDHGAFVAIRSECDTMRDEDVVFFNGTSLRHAGQAQCPTRTLGQQGMIYRLQAECIGGPGANGQANLTATTPDRTHLALTPRGQDTRLYRYCATGSLTQRLQNEAGR